MPSRCAAAFAFLTYGIIQAPAARTSTLLDDEVLHNANLTSGSVVFGRYKILHQLWPPEGFVLDHKIAAGQFGVAYLATRTSDEKKVVLKVFKDQLGLLINTGKTLNGDQKLRLASASRECQAATDLRNAKGDDEVGKGRFMECFEDGTNLGAEAYVEMEYIPGQTLEAWNAAFDWDYPPPAELTNVVKMMLQGLAHIEEKYVHRDIKEDNVMVIPGDEMKLKFIDFGFVTEANKKTADTAGTLLYQPPEAIKDQDNYIPRPSWDVWSVGIMVYQILCQNKLVKELMEEMVGTDPMKLQVFQFDKAKMAELASKLEIPKTFTENCVPYEDLQEEQDYAGLLSVLDLVLTKVLVKEDERKKASELLTEAIFQ